MSKIDAKKASPRAVKRMTPEALTHTTGPTGDRPAEPGWCRGVGGSTFSNTFHHIDARKYLPGQKFATLHKKRTRFLETKLKEPASTRLTPQGGRRIVQTTNTS